MQKTNGTPTMKRVKRTVMVCAATLALTTMVAMPAFAADVNGPSGTTSDLTLQGTVKDKPIGTISVTMPTTLAFNVDLNADGKFESLSQPAAARIENRSSDAAVAAAITSVTDGSPTLLNQVDISLNGQKLVVGASQNIGLGQAAANGSLGLALTAQPLANNPVITSGSYSVTTVITLSRVANP